MDYQTGKLLIATPELADPNFFRTVSLIIHHDAEGAAGVILNRPSNTPLSEIWDDLEPQGVGKQAIHLGGPCESPLMAVHSSLALAERSIFTGVYLSFSRDNLRELVLQTKHPVKVFSGHAGWGPGQLEAEMEQGGWLTFPTDTDDLFETPEELWKIACGKVGNEIMFSKPSFDLNSIDPMSN